MFLLLAVALGLRWLLRAERGGVERAPASEMRGAESAPAAIEAPVPGAGAARSAAPEPGAASGDALEDADGERGLELPVRVRDSCDLRAIAGALVTTFESASPLPRRTDDRGRCSLFVQRSREPLRVRIEAAGYVHSDSGWERQGAIDVELLRAATIFGRVLAADTREPVAGARLALEHSYCDRCEPDVVSSGPDGGYELAGVPLEELALLAITAEGFPSTTREFRLSPGERRVEQDLHLVRGAELSGSVVDWTSGAPIPGARVLHLPTDETGRFAGHFLTKPGTTIAGLTVQADGYAMLHDEVDGASEGELEYRLPRLAFFEGGRSRTRCSGSRRWARPWRRMGACSRARRSTSCPPGGTSTQAFPGGRAMRRGGTAFRSCPGA